MDVHLRLKKNKENVNSPSAQGFLFFTHDGNNILSFQSRPVGEEGSGFRVDIVGLSDLRQ